MEIARKTKREKTTNVLSLGQRIERVSGLGENDDKSRNHRRRTLMINASKCQTPKMMSLVILKNLSHVIRHRAEISRTG